MLPNPATAMRFNALASRIAELLVTASRDDIPAHDLCAHAITVARRDPRWVESRPTRPARTAVDELTGG